MRVANSMVKQSFQHPISRFWDLIRFGDNTSQRLLNSGPGEGMQNGCRAFMWWFVWISYTCLQKWRAKNVMININFKCISNLIRTLWAMSLRNDVLCVVNTRAQINVYFTIWKLHIGRHMQPMSYDDIHVNNILPMSPLFFPFTWNIVIINKWLNGFRICMLRHQHQRIYMQTSRCFRNNVYQPYYPKNIFVPT